MHDGYMNMTGRYQQVHSEAQTDQGIFHEDATTETEMSTTIADICNLSSHSTFGKTYGS